jgi:hypothetical protein
MIEKRQSPNSRGRLRSNRAAAGKHLPMIVLICETLNVAILIKLCGLSHRRVRRGCPSIGVISNAFVIGPGKA